MADNHSPYDPDPRQGNQGGNTRTQALQAVSFFFYHQSLVVEMGSAAIVNGWDRRQIRTTSAIQRHHYGGASINPSNNDATPTTTEFAGGHGPLDT